eukprot:403341544
MAYIDIIFDDMQIPRIYLNYPKFNIDYRKIEALVIKDHKIINIDTVEVQLLYQLLNPYFEEEKLFYTSISQIMQKLLTNQALNDQEKHIFSLDQPFCNFDKDIALNMRIGMADGEQLNQSLINNEEDNVSSINGDIQSQSEESFINMHTDMARQQSSQQNYPVINISGVDDIQKSIIRDNQKKRKNKKKKKRGPPQQQQISEADSNSYYQEVEMKQSEEQQLQSIDSHQEFIPQNSQSGQILSDIFTKFAQEQLQLPLTSNNKNAKLPQTDEDLLKFKQLQQELRIVRNSPIISQILLSMYLDIKESQNKQISVELEKQNLITEIQQQKVSNLHLTRQLREAQDQCQTFKKENKKFKKQLKKEKELKQLEISEKSIQVQMPYKKQSKKGNLQEINLEENFLSEAAINERMCQDIRDKEGFLNDQFLLDFMFLKAQKVDKEQSHQQFSNTTTQIVNQSDNQQCIQL